MKKLLSLIITFSLILPGSSFAAREPETDSNAGVTTTEFGSSPSSGTDTATSSGAPPRSGADSSSARDRAIARAIARARGTSSSGSSPLPTPAPGCDNTCDWINAANDQEAGACGNNATCKSCMNDKLGKSQLGQYCEAKEKYDKGVTKQGIDAGLYVAGAAFCYAACFNIEPFSKAIMESACKVGSIGLAVNTLMQSKNMTENELETAAWLKTVNKISTTASNATAAVFVAQALGVQAINAAVSGVLSSQALSCVTAGLLTLTAATKGVHAAEYRSKRKELCGNIEEFDLSVAKSTTNACRNDAGMGPWSNSTLSFNKPKPFVFNLNDPDVSAVNDGGLIGELYQDKEGLKKAYQALKPEIRRRFEDGEDPLAVARDTGMLPGALLDQAQEHAAKYKPGQPNAFLGGGDAVTKVASTSGAKAATGDGVGFEAFGNNSVAASAAGEGVSAEDFGAAGAGALGAGGTCGQGPLHEGCGQSIFRIVSDQLSRKSKDESVAQLSPVLPLNQMRAGLKVNIERSPASTPSKVK